MTWWPYSIVRWLLNHILIPLPVPVRETPITVGDVALWFQALILLASAVWAWKAIKEAKSARDLKATREIFTQIGAEEIRAGRRWVLGEMELSGALLTNQEFELAKRVAVSMDRVAYMVAQGLVPEFPLFVWQRDEICQLWDKLEPVVRFVRSQTERPHYCRHFQYLARTWFPEMRSKYENVPAGYKPNYRNRVWFDLVAARNRRLTEKMLRQRDSIPLGERCMICGGNGKIQDEDTLVYRACPRCKNSGRQNSWLSVALNAPR